MPFSDDRAHAACSVADGLGSGAGTPDSRSPAVTLPPVPWTILRTVAPRGSRSPFRIREIVDGGTPISAALSDDSKYLLVHVLHLDDPQALIAEIKTRYEKPLMEIFP